MLPTDDSRGLGCSCFRSHDPCRDKPKGGAVKTTTAINLGTALPAIGGRAPLIDLDPQGNASTGPGVDRSQRVAGSQCAGRGTHAQVDRAVGIGS